MGSGAAGSGVALSGVVGSGLAASGACSCGAASGVFSVVVSGDVGSVALSGVPLSCCWVSCPAVDSELGAVEQAVPIIATNRHASAKNPMPRAFDGLDKKILEKGGILESFLKSGVLHILFLFFFLVAFQKSAELVIADMSLPGSCDFAIWSNEDHPRKIVDLVPVCGA